MKLRVFDSTQGTVVFPDVVEVDTAREPSNVLARNLQNLSNRGIWLNPYRGVPQVSWIPALDIVYIDEHFRALWCIENHRQGTTNLPEIFVSSALILPSGAANGARIRRGDQLELRDAASGLRWSRQSGLHDGAAVDSAIDSPAKMAAKMTDGQRSHPETRKKGLRQVFGWLFESNEEPSSRRKAERRAIPGLVAYLPVANTSQPFEVRNISTEGFYVLTEERWSPGTSLVVSLQIINPASQRVEAMISVPSKVVWLGPDGVGFTFDDELAHWNPRIQVRNVEELSQLQRFLHTIKG